MSRCLVLTVVLGILAGITSMSQAEKNDGPVEKNKDFIKAEVSGTLRFETGRGYFITVKSTDKPEREYRVWLWISENKITVRQLESLTDNHVLAQGNLEQMPEDVHASVPPKGMYMSHFKIEGVETK